MVEITTQLIEKSFRDHYRPLCLYAWNIVKSEADAEDIVQQLFTDLLEARAQGKRQEVEDMKSYLYICVRNRAARCLGATDARLPVEAAATVPDDETERQEMAEREARLWDWIDALPPRRRDILLAVKRDGLSYQEAARKLGVSVKTLEGQLARTVKALRDTAARVYFFLLGL